MADAVIKWTDEKLVEMEKEISSIYKEAQADITRKWDAYMARGEQRLSKLHDAYVASGTAEAKEAYEAALRNYTLGNNDYKAMVDEVTLRLAKTNEIALAYSKGELPEIYAKNYGAIEEVLAETGLDQVIKVLPEDTIKHMVLQGEATTPWIRKALDEGKDIKWNRKQINSSVLQGIIQGESIPKIAKRLEPIMDKNEVSALRNARTLVTGAQNAGRLDSYKALEDDGVVLKKVWEATGDGRTRDIHLDMDGQEVELDKSFDDGVSSEIMYPGDPRGAPESVYNCRCSMSTHIIGYRKKDGSIVHSADIKGYADRQHDSAIRAEKERRKNA